MNRSNFGKEIASPSGKPGKNPFPPKKGDGIPFKKGGKVKKKK